MAIENDNAIEEHRSKIVRNRVLIAICRHTGDKWQSKTLFLSIFDPRLLINDSVFRLPPTWCVDVKLTLCLLGNFACFFIVC